MKKTFVQEREKLVKYLKISRVPRIGMRMNLSTSEPLHLSNNPHMNIDMSECRCKIGTKTGKTKTTESRWRAGFVELIGCKMRLLSVLILQ